MDKAALRELAEDARHAIEQGHKRYQAEEGLRCAITHESILELTAALEQAQDERRALLATEQNLREEIQSLTEERTAWRVAAENAEKDAERYRWLREQDDEDFCFSVVKNPHFDVFESGQQLDAAIDAAIKEEK